MPQFDYYSFLSQVIWVFIPFICLYLILLRGILPSIATILKSRNKILNLNLDNSSNNDYQVADNFLMSGLKGTANSLQEINSYRNAFLDRQKPTKSLNLEYENYYLYSGLADARTKYNILAAFGLKNYS